MARRTLRSITDSLVARANERLGVLNTKMDDAAVRLGQFVDDAVDSNLGENALSSGLASMSQITYRGSVGDFTSFEEMITLKARFTDLVDINPTEYGSPLCQRRRLDTLPGFIMCQNPHMELTRGTISEATAIETFMAGGFFYE